MSCGELANLKSRLPLVDLIRRSLALKKLGDRWVALCPFHNERTPSFNVRPNYYHCFGCGAHGDHFDWLMQREHLAFGEAVRRLRELTGTPHIRKAATEDGQRRAPAYERSNGDDARRIEAALSIWQSAVPARGTLVERYLISRGLHVLPPPTLRFHAGLKHRSGGIWPAMLTLVTSGADDTPLAIHRTFLARDGSRKAPVDPQKMMLGPCHGGAVRLAAPGDMLMVGEGIETCLAAMQATGHPVWAALSTAGLRTLELPAEVRDVVVLADGDEPGDAAARDCALRWKREGRRVRIARPPQGMDFNDMLVRAVSSGDSQ
jgi:phage/plasmid primase-like uncharacterized protein